MTRAEQAERAAVRAAAGAGGKPWPITVVPGGDAPRVAGDGFGWRTRGGRPIRHPSAYSRRGWSNMVYQPSTRCVVVGAGWLSAHRAAAGGYVG